MSNFGIDASCCFVRLDFPKHYAGSRFQLVYFAIIYSSFMTILNQDFVVCMESDAYQLRSGMQFQANLLVTSRQICNANLTQIMNYM